jgi:hypothetical protein
MQHVKQVQFNPEFADYEDNFFRGAIPAYLRIDHKNNAEMDLNLTLSDIDDDEEPIPFLFEMDERPA